MLKFKTKRVIVAMTDSEYDDLKRLAQEERLTVSAYLRWVIGHMTNRKPGEESAPPQITDSIQTLKKGMPGKGNASPRE